jgi:transposase
VHGVVRWRRVDLQRLIAERFGVAYHERTAGKILHRLGFSHISARPRHPAQDGQTVAAFKKRMARPVRKGFVQAQLISLRQRIRPRG